MVKVIIFISVLFTSLHSFADCKDRRAWVRAEVTERATDNLTYCRVKINFIEFREHSICPLTPEDFTLQSRGVSMPLANGHDCDVYVGQILEGELIVNSLEAYIVD